MCTESASLWCSNVFEQFETFTKHVDDKIGEELQQLKACRKKTEMDTKLAQELKLYNELSDRLFELSRRGSELNRVCASLETHLTIAESDQNRLNNAKETYQLGKELTGIRLNFSAPPTVAKGYIKSEPRKLLQPFEVPAGDSEALWILIKATAAPGWPDKENLPDN